MLCRHDQSTKSLQHEEADTIEMVPNKAIGASSPSSTAQETIQRPCSGSRSADGIGKAAAMADMPQAKAPQSSAGTALQTQASEKPARAAQGVSTPEEDRCSLDPTSACPEPSQQKGRSGLVKLPSQTTCSHSSSSNANKRPSRAGAQCSAAHTSRPYQLPHNPKYHSA